MHTHARTLPALLLFILVATLPAVAAARTLLILGDSLSAGYGIPSGQGWVRLLQERLEQQPGDWSVVNASISGETTDGGLRRLPALLERYQPAVVVIELGGNDGLRGFPPELIENNLARMIELTREAGAQAVLVGMQMPPNYGPRYTRAFADIYPRLSDRYNLPLVPFFLDGIYDRDDLMQADGIHPNADAQPRLLDNIWPVLAPLLAATEPATAR